MGLGLLGMINGGQMPPLAAVILPSPGKLGDNNVHFQGAALG
jgi:hypothetical protein